MTYRNELEAAHARIAQLETDLDHERTKHTQDVLFAISDAGEINAADRGLFRKMIDLENITRGARGGGETDPNTTPPPRSDPPHVYLRNRMRGIVAYMIVGALVMAIGYLIMAVFLK